MQALGRKRTGPGQYDIPKKQLKITRYGENCSFGFSINNQYVLSAGHWYRLLPTNLPQDTLERPS